MHVWSKHHHETSHISRTAEMAWLHRTTYMYVSHAAWSLIMNVFSTLYICTYTCTVRAVKGSSVPAINRLKNLPMSSTRMHWSYQTALVLCMYNMPAQLSTNSSIPKYHLIVAFLEQSTGVYLVTVIGNWFSPLTITVQLKANGNQKYSRIMER